MPPWRRNLFSMQIKFFTIPVINADNRNDELNKFLRTNKILEIENHLTQINNNAYWCLCVKYFENGGYFTTTDKQRVDYRDELDENTFKIFARLREVRKQIAMEEAVPAYAVCTDQELASIAKLQEITVLGIRSVKGIGEKKVEKYGERIVKLINQ